LVDIERMSNLLFGRYQALQLYATVARLSKPEFTTGELAALTRLPPAACSKELGRLTDLRMLRIVSRRGEYERDDQSCFWRFIDELASEWES
jgi:hypothetical protein